jgi:hypothetical protein
VVDVWRAEEEQTGDAGSEAARCSAAHESVEDRTQSQRSSHSQQAARQEGRSQDSQQRADHGLKQWRIVGEDVGIGIYPFVDALPLRQQPRLVEHQTLAVVQLIAIAQGQQAEMHGEGQVEQQSGYGNEPERQNWLSL